MEAANNRNGEQSGVLRAGVIGVGHLGQHHARIYGLLPGVQLAGVFDTDPVRARDVAARCNTRACESLDDLLGRVDAVSVAVPTIGHHAVAAACMARCIHVMVEKPFTRTVEEAEELVRLAREKKCVLQVGHIERFNPAVSYIKDAVSRPRFIEVHRLAPFKGRSTDIGVVLDLAVHDLDIVLHLVNSPVAHLDAVGVSVLSPTEDIANIRIRFEDGCVANITCSRVSLEEMRKIRVFSDQAYLSLDYKAQEGYLVRKEGGSLVRHEIPLEKEEPLRAELVSFVECVRSKDQPFVSGEQGKRVLEIALEITRQIRAGAPVPSGAGA